MDRLNVMNPKQTIPPTPSGNHNRQASTSFPVTAGILLGLGMGGFFDGIVLHQILQWHHMLSSAGFAPDNVRNLQINTLADGLFHASTYVFVLWGLILFWRAARRPHQSWSSTSLVATMLVGFGLFNTVEGLVNHQLLGIHHVNESVPQAQWIYWDVGFVVWGVTMVLAGWLLMRRNNRRALTASSPAFARPDEAATAGASSGPVSGVSIPRGSASPDNTSVAGEEDPGAALELVSSPSNVPRQRDGNAPHARVRG